MSLIHTFGTVCDFQGYTVSVRYFYTASDVSFGYILHGKRVSREDTDALLLQSRVCVYHLFQMDSHRRNDTKSAVPPFVPWICSGCAGGWYAYLK